MEVKYLPIINARINAKKLACVGGVAILAGASAWGLWGDRRALTENIFHKTLAPKAAQIANPPAPPAAAAKQEKKEPAKLFAPQKYTVQSGDTLSKIAEDYKIDVDTILSANPKAGEVIYPGEELKILPAKGIMYEVKAGDCLWRIGQDYDVTVADIVKANQKIDDQVAVGENIFIPGARYARLETRSAMREQTESSRSMAMPARLIWPVGGEISSPYGWRWGRMHTGIDIANAMGTPVMAASAGRVIWAGTKGGYGNAVMIDHGGGYVTLYGHLSNFFVTKGQIVRAGQRIASVGSTGNSTGPHLHFEVIKNGEPINPMSALP
jgi:murein DD-endopeptidase MepM/ murein hydrolase activator NlpD